MVNIWRNSFGMKKEENECSGEKQLELNVVLHEVYCNVSCGSILLILLEVESRIQCSSFPILAGGSSPFAVSYRVWKACPQERPRPLGLAGLEKKRLRSDLVEAPAEGTWTGRC